MIPTMKLVSFLLFSLVCLCSTALDAQAPVAGYTVQDLKEHGLLVWLPDSKRKIEALRKNDMHKEAEKEAALVKKQNETMVRYFREHFKFCQVYFFYTSQEEDLKNGLPVLLNEAFIPDEAIPLPAKQIIGGFYIKQSAEHHPFPYRHFKIENSSIRMNLHAERWRPFWMKKRTYKTDVIRLDKKLHRMMSRS